MTMQHYSHGGWEDVRRRIPWIQIFGWIFLAGIAWAKLSSLSESHREVESTYARKDVLSVEMKALGEKIDMQTERIRQLESQIHRLRADLSDVKGR